ncbi:hypothetical protein FRC14_003572 [Serendipita sp. 396]|nr:hypothetical protein FRC14_003572 [Serendipita sp. 396]KAG8803443.1 hypothetical protein FRC16_005375 [Serendipita sp. 398]
MSDRSYVRFALDRDEEFPSRSPIQSPRVVFAQDVTGVFVEEPCSPRSPSSRNTVRFMPGPVVGSPVLREPTPYRGDMIPLSEEENEGDGRMPAFVNMTPPVQPHLPRSPFSKTQDHFPGIQQTSEHRNSPSSSLSTPQLKGPRILSPDTFDYPSDGEDTAYEGNSIRSSIEKDPALPPPVHLRNDDATVRSTPPLRPALKKTNTNLEEGGIPARHGIMHNLMSLYGLSTRSADHDDMTLTPAPSSMNQSEMRLRQTCDRKIDDTLSSLGVNESKPLDPDHPFVTGVKKNTRGQALWDTQMKKTGSRGSRITYHVATKNQRHKFILRLAKALMTYGAPSHRIESQLDATALVLEVDAQFVHLPSVIIASFGDHDNHTSDTHFVKANGRLALGKLHKVHQVYRQVVHDEISAEEGTIILNRLLKEKPLYGSKTRMAIAFVCCALICPLAFGGSFLDMFVAGGCGGLLSFLQIHAASRSAMYANVFELSVAILISFIARGLSAIPGRYFCYEAISSAGVVLILPGYLILCSALELASKNIVNGSVRMIYAIIYSLFLGFGLTIGSDLYYIVDPRAKRERLQEAIRAATTTSVSGRFISDNSTLFSSFEGSFTFSNKTEMFEMNSQAGCFRNPAWPWYQQDFPYWTLFLLVPAFSLFSSSWNLQPLKSKQLPVMVIISCAAFAANTAANRYIINRSDVVSAIGAFVVGILGNAYSRIFRGTAFQSMVIGVLFLVPSGIAAAGGLSENYRGQDGDQYTNGLAIGLRMVQVAIGITVGLFGSGLIVYSFGSRKQAALFAF